MPHSQPPLPPPPPRFIELGEGMIVWTVLVVVVSVILFIVRVAGHVFLGKSANHPASSVVTECHRVSPAPAAPDPVLKPP